MDLKYCRYEKDGHVGHHFHNTRVAFASGGSLSVKEILQRQTRGCVLCPAHHCTGRFPVVFPGLEFSIFAAGLMGLLFLPAK